MLTAPMRCGAAAALLLAAAASASAEIIEATFTGEVSFLETVLQVAGAPFDQIELGDPFELTYVFDSETPNLLTAGTLGDATGRYTILSLKTKIGPFESAVVPSATLAGFISVHNATSNPDHFYVGAELPDSLLSYDLAISAQLEDSTSTAFSSVVLPESITPAAFDSAVLRLGQAGNFLAPAEPRLFVEAGNLSYTSRVVPEPMALTLALLGVAWIGTRRSPIGRHDSRRAGRATPTALAQRE